MQAVDWRKKARAVWCFAEQGEAAGKVYACTEGKVELFCFASSPAVCVVASIFFQMCFGRTNRNGRMSFAEAGVTTLFKKYFCKVAIHVLPSFTSFTFQSSGGWKLSMCYGTASRPGRRQAAQWHPVIHPPCDPPGPTAGSTSLAWEQWGWRKQRGNETFLFGNSFWGLEVTMWGGKTWSYHLCATLHWGVLDEDIQWWPGWALWIMDAAPWLKKYSSPPSHLASPHSL